MVVHGHVSGENTDRLQDGLGARMLLYLLLPRLSHVSSVLLFACKINMAGPAQASWPSNHFIKSLYPSSWENQYDRLIMMPI